ncbi:MAG: hypothetical protein E6J15_01045 [Chloroflexi bacterium]|nr:MAG: hypothetical protein E6J15_01045 [Chloroflexota bacterium]
MLVLEGEQIVRVLRSNHRELALQPTHAPCEVRGELPVAASRRGSLAVFFANFRASEIPLPRRLVVAARNLARRAVLRQGCCGHDGEPGC